MAKIRLGQTELMVEKNGFGCLPIQRITKEEAKELLLHAVAGGMNFFDTARAYSDSEEKMGYAFQGIRESLIIATKSHAKTGAELKEHLEISLKNLQTDYVDLLQFHNPAYVPTPGDEFGLYDAALELKAEGKIRHIGITNHRIAVAKEAAVSGLYETMQFPFSYLAGEQEHELLALCQQNDVGFIAMKALAGGLISNGTAAAAYMETCPQVVPIWGVQRMWELEEFLHSVKAPIPMTADIEAIMEKDRRELAGDFCRGCGYCMPCPVGIEINTCARMSLLLRRAVVEVQVDESMQKNMNRIDDCIGCGACKTRCPYGLDIPNLLKANLADYRDFLAKNT